MGAFLRLSILCHGQILHRKDLQKGELAKSRKYRFANFANLSKLYPQPFAELTFLQQYESVGESQDLLATDLLICLCRSNFEPV